MRTEDVLESIGLGEGERKVYLALLKLGSVPVQKLKEETNLHRTTIYDFIEKLLNKGLVNYVIQGGTKFFKATHPNKLLEYVREKEEGVQDILPELRKLAEFQKEKITVEVYKGPEGFKTALNDLLREKKDYVGFGINESMFRERFGTGMDQFFRKEKKLGIKERMLTYETAPFVYGYSHISYRYLPKESFNPTSTFVYGSKVGIIIWEPLTFIRIDNAQLADSSQAL